MLGCTVLVAATLRWRDAEAVNFLGGLWNGAT